MNDNVPIDIGGSVRMAGGPTIHAFIPRASVVRINVLGGSHPAGARRLPPRSCLYLLYGIIYPFPDVRYITVIQSDIS